MNYLENIVGLLALINVYMYILCKHVYIYTNMHVYMYTDKHKHECTLQVNIYSLSFSC